MTRKLGIAAAVLFPLLYVISLLITGDPDRIGFLLGPFGFIIWFVQWIAFAFGGWVAAIIATIILLAFAGYCAGLFLEWLISKLASKGPKNEDR